MKAAIISLGSTSSKWTFEAMKRYFEEVDDMDLRDVEVDVGAKQPLVLYKGRPLGDYDCVFLKGSFRYLQILSSIAAVLEGKVYMPICSSAFPTGHDKLLTHLALQKHNIPMPETYISSNPAAAKQLLERLSYPIVMKFPSGTQGKGVMFADSYVSASSMLDALSALNQPVLIQSYVETGGKDVRAIVVGDKVAAAMRRQAVEGEKRANIHAGGKGIPAELDYKTKELAVRTAKAVGAAVCAVDILEGTKGPLVIEINLSPGLQGITDATGIDVADKIAAYLYEGAKKFSGSAAGAAMKHAAGLSSSAQTIVSEVKMNRDQILLPKIATELSGLEKGDDILVSVEKNSIVVTKSKRVAGKEETVKEEKNTVPKKPVSKKPAVKKGLKKSVKKK
ncbi:RimK family alpha-L-glutamate ligase [Candidatus Woesearchaeota archaeon]|nr:RimK family alpha-L-glutamate ligase [Candidatus Woesearchaeota archaeon]